jgi:hypothetical protein
MSLAGNSHRQYAHTGRRHMPERGGHAEYMPKQQPRLSPQVTAMPVKLPLCGDGCLPTSDLSAYP